MHDVRLFNEIILTHGSFLMQHLSMQYLSAIITWMFISSASAFYADLREELFHQTNSRHKTLGYDRARQIMFNQLYLQKDKEGYFVQDVYCGDKYYLYQNNEVPGTRLPDAVRMNTEHSWPQSQFNSKYSKTTQKSDLHHLYPTTSKINSERGSHPFAEVRSTRDLSCPFSQLGMPEQGARITSFEPPDSHKGNLARSMFYFSIRYKISLDPVEEFYFRVWNILDPVDKAERERHEIIFSVQKNRNPFIDDPTLVDQIQDF